MSRYRDYQQLAKSGIVALVVISVAGGYLIGHPFERPLNALRLLISLLGVLALAAGSSALNQIQERDIDAQMPRTQSRPLPSGRMSLRQAWAFCLAALALGAALLWALDPKLAGLGALAVASYNGLYTLWWKPRLAYAAIPGAIPGAIPILMGTTAASGSILTPVGIYLFAILFFWQMPHFWSLAIRFRDDYAAGGIPTLPVARGELTTRREIMGWTVAYVLLGCAAHPFVGTSRVYLGVAVVMGIKIVWELGRFLRTSHEETRGAWLRFFLWINVSLIVYLAAMAADLWSTYLVVPLTRGP